MIRKDCYECAGKNTSVLAAPFKKEIEYRRMIVILPDDYRVWICQACEASYMDDDQIDALSIICEEQRRAAISKGSRGNVK